MGLGGTEKDSNNWKKVLLEIYRFAPSMWGESIKRSKYDPRHDLAKRCGFKNSELGNIIVFLEDQRLIETKVDEGNKEYSASWILTEKGFDVSLELEKQLREIREKRKHDELQLSLIFLTFVLAITASANFAIEIYPQFKVYYFWFYGIFLMGFLFGILLKFIFRKR